jgi:hypothetical protein
MLVLIGNGRWPGWHWLSESGQGVGRSEEPRRAESSVMLVLIGNGRWAWVALAERVRSRCR